jgi:hypothetical protein
MRYRMNDEEVKAAVWRIARTPEGQLLFSALQSVVEEIGPVETCALHAHNERRKFAANLVAMAEADKRDGTVDEEVERRNGTARTSTRKSRRHGPAGRD